MTLLWLNFGLMINRIVQRVIFVTGYYGLTQGLLSVLRSSSVARWTLAQLPSTKR